MQRVKANFERTASPDRLRRCVLALVVAALCGCNRGPETAQVTGIVRLDGKPLTVGTVRFTPAAGRAAAGRIASDGTFELGTFGESDGALIGVHGVAISAYEAPTSQPNYDVDKATSKSIMPAWYASADSSGLTFDVKAGEKNRAEFNLSSK